MNKLETQSQPLTGNFQMVCNHMKIFPVQISVTIFTTQNRFDVLSIEESMLVFLGDNEPNHWPSQVLLKQNRCNSRKSKLKELI